MVVNSLCLGDDLGCGLDGFLSTWSKTDEECEELKAANAKNAIIKFKEEGTPLVRLPELRQRLQFMLPAETFDEKELWEVVCLML